MNDQRRKAGGGGSEEEEAELGKVDGILNDIGLYLGAASLFGMAINLVGLRLKRLPIKPEQWPILAVVVLAAIVSYAVGNRRRLQFAIPASVVGCVLLIVLSVLNHMRFPLATIAATADTGTKRPIASKQLRSDWLDPYELLVGRLAPKAPTLSFEIHGESTPEECRLIMGWIHDQVPNAECRDALSRTTLVAGADPQPAPSFDLSPVPNTADLLEKIPFATATPIDAYRVRLELRRPLPTLAETVPTRALYYLAELQQPEELRQIRAAKNLEKLAPLAMREQIAEELLKLFQRPKRMSEFTEALIVWGTKLEVPALEQMEASANPSDVPTIKRVIGALKAQ